MLPPSKQLVALKIAPSPFAGIRQCLQPRVQRRPSLCRRLASAEDPWLRHCMVVATLHGESIHLFADLFAAWTVGATVACLDGSLTEFSRAVCAP
jgi:hypothetical protein